MINVYFLDVYIKFVFGIIYFLLAAPLSLISKLRL